MLKLKEGRARMIKEAYNTYFLKQFCVVSELIQRGMGSFADPIIQEIYQTWKKIPTKQPNNGTEPH